MSAPDDEDAINAPGDPNVRTRIFARVLGPFFAIVPATIAVRGENMRTLLDEFGSNPMWPWLFGAILLLFGTLIIAFHQFWRGVAPVLVSLLGWFLFIRGVLLLTVPQRVTQAGEALTSRGAYIGVRVFFLGLACVGLYLTYVGWIAKPRPRPGG